MTPLIDAPELLGLTAASSADAVVIVDVSFDLADPHAGERSWREGHLPGSLYRHLDRDLCGPRTGRNGRHPLPEREVFEVMLGACGIGPTTRVVVLDRQGGLFAARFWWMLRWMGHEAVSVLDGGVAAWSGAGGVLTTDVAVPIAAPPYPAAAPLVATIDVDALAARLGRVVLLDARAGERFCGEVEPLDAQAGHIPGALNRFYQDNLGPNGRFKPAAELRAAFERLLGVRAPSDVVHQCGSGVSACHNILAMAHAGLGGSTAGRDGPVPVLYPGSWSEWSADPARPVARGGVNVFHDPGRSPTS